MSDFITPQNHINFLAKKLFEEAGEIVDGSIAYLEKGGDGPAGGHVHEHNHLFIVVKGEAKVTFEDSEVVIKENESYLVDGGIPHSVWNSSDNTTVMVGISVK